MVELDEDDLQDEVNMINAMGNPVQEFLNSEEFTSVDPSIEDPSEVRTYMVHMSNIYSSKVI